MPSNLKIGLLFLCLLLPALSVYLEIDRSQFCFALDQKQGSTYKFYYQSLARQSHLEVMVRNKQFKIFLTGRINETVFSASQQSQICLKSNGQLEPVSIDFYIQEESKFKELALRSQVYEVHEELIGVGKSIKEMIHYEQFEEQRQAVHAQIIESHERTIYFYGVLKMLLVVVIAISQIILLQRTLGTSKVREYFSFE